MAKKMNVDEAIEAFGSDERMERIFEKYGGWGSDVRLSKGEILADFLDDIMEDLGPKVVETYRLLNRD